MALTKHSGEQGGKPRESQIDSDSVPESTLRTKLGDSQVGARNDLDISRHVFFGEISYVVRDPYTYEGHNLSPADYEILTNLRDDWTLSEVFDNLVEHGTLEKEDEDSFFRFVVELQKRNLLSLPITDGESLYNQMENRRKLQSKNPIMKLLFLKISLGCPDRFLKNTYHYAKCFFSPIFLSIWLIGFAIAGLLIASKWTEFTSDLASVLAVQNIPLILITMSVLKLWHELGHGYACRHYGVAVPNAGILFMIGTPLAFMDATGSWSLSKRSQRQVINLAGIYFEMMIAIIATFVWAFSTNDFVRSIAHFTLLVSSVTTIGFNINPLMKYDGYFVFADMLGIPNLKSRASATIKAFFKQLFFGIKMPASKSFALSLILCVYGVASSVYKLLLVIGISAMIALKLWVVGLVVAGYYMITSFAGMLLGLVKYLIWSNDAQRNRILATTYLLVICVGIPSLLMLCPIPGRANARGIAEPTNLHVIHLEESGILQALDVSSGRYVAKDMPLATIQNTELFEKQSKRKAKLASLVTKYKHDRNADARVLSEQTKQELNALQYEISASKHSKEFNQIVAPMNGRIVSSLGKRSIGKHFDAGTELARIGKGGWKVRAVANSNAVADIDPTVGQTVQCRFISNPKVVFEGTIDSVSLAGSRQVPHKALTQLGGGFIVVEEQDMSAREPFFEMTISLDQKEGFNFLNCGSVCEIRFTKKPSSLGMALYRALLRFKNKVNLN